MKLKHIFSVLAIILVSGCIGGSQIAPISPVVHGDSGLDFTIQNVPDYLQSGSTFSFILEIINWVVVDFMEGSSFMSDSIRIGFFVANTVALLLITMLINKNEA